MSGEAEEALKVSQHQPDLEALFPLGTAQPVPGAPISGAAATGILRAFLLSRRP